jgi:hypothetical protein
MIALLLGSCLMVPHRRTRDLYIETGYEETIKTAELVLEAVTVHKGFDSHTLETNAAYILNLMLVRRNQALAGRGKSLSIRALIKEEEFSREYRRFNTVTVELSIYDSPKTQPIALMLYSENTKETIDSYAYLHSVLRRIFRRISG